MGKKADDARRMKKGSKLRGSKKKKTAVADTLNRGVGHSVGGNLQKQLSQFL